MLAAKEIQAIIERFLGGCRRPCLWEPGEESLAITRENFALESRNGSLQLQAWDDRRNLGWGLVAVHVSSTCLHDVCMEAAGPGAAFARIRRSRRVFRSRYAPPLQAAHARIVVVRLVEAQYENGVLRPVERLGLRPGERVNLMVLRRPDPRRWDLARLSSTSNQEDLSLSEQGLADWADSLDPAEPN